MKPHRIRVIAAGISTIGMVALGMGTATAAGTSTTTHESFPVTGAVFKCAAPTGNITARSGTIDDVSHFNVDAQGIVHFTGTDTPHGVTLQDAAGSWYTLSGADWHGGKATSFDTEPFMFTDTEHFVLRNVSTGGIVKVQMVAHVSQNGSFFMDQGTCQAPEGG